MENKNQIDDVEIDFDGVVENEGTGFDVFPEGTEVIFKVETVERGRNADGTKPQVKMKLSLTPAKGEGRSSCTEFLTMTRKSEWKICEFFTSLGLRKHGEQFRLRWDIEGLRGRATVGVDTWANKTTGAQMTGNNIKKFLDPREGDNFNAGDGVAAQCVAELDPQFD